MVKDLYSTIQEDFVAQQDLVILYPTPVDFAATHIDGHSRVIVK